MRWQDARAMQEEAKKAEAAEKRASEARRKAAEERKAVQAKQVALSTCPDLRIPTIICKCTQHTTFKHACKHEHWLCSLPRRLCTGCFH